LCKLVQFGSKFNPISKHRETKIKDLHNTNFGHLFHTIGDKIFYIITFFLQLTKNFGLLCTTKENELMKKMSWFCRN
jgi:hypothetical protein